MMIRVELPYQLRMLANIPGELSLEVPPPVTLGSFLDSLESCFPMLRGTIRDQITQKRRPLLRFFACETDWSNESADKPLPEAVVNGEEVLVVLGAIAGG